MTDTARGRDWKYRIASRINKLLHGENIETFPLTDDQHKERIQQLDKERMEAEERKALRKLFGRARKPPAAKP
jgi:hypothetical protein